MIDLLQIAADVATHAADAGVHAAASSNPVEGLASSFKVEWEKLLAQIINILAIFVALYFLAWKPLLRILDERRKKIADGLQYAEEMKTKLAEAERKQSEILKEAAIEAKQIQTDAQKNARSMVEKAQADAQRKAQELIQQTRDGLELERRQMLTELKEHSAKLIAATTARVLRHELSDEEKKRYAARAVSELEES